MEKIFIFFSVIFMLTEGSLYAFENGDFQYWNKESISVEIKKNWEMLLEEEFRFGDDSSKLYYRHSDIGIVYSGLAEWLDLGINYRYIHEKDKGKWLIENKPHFNAVLKWKVFDINLSDRSLFEYRIRENKNNFFRYRNKLTVNFPFELTKFKIQPYTADEVFFDFNQKKINRNRVYTGFKMKLFDNFQANIYYLIQSSKNEKWKNWHILGTSLKFVF